MSWYQPHNNANITATQRSRLRSLWIRRQQFTDMITSELS